jgi:uncharacterized membrane protein
MVTEPVREPGKSTPFGGERDPARVVAFSDGVIAIAVTLLVLEIHPPPDTQRLLHGLATLWPSYLAYVITFMLIGQVWANHHVMFDQIRSVDRVVLFLNTVLLMDIAFLPFAASVLAQAFRDGEGERIAIVLHGMTFELAAILFNAIWWYARHDHRFRRCESHWSALPARPCLDRHRNLAGRPASCSRRGCDRRVHCLLLAPHPRRDRQGEAPARRWRSGVTAGAEQQQDGEPSSVNGASVARSLDPTPHSTKQRGLITRPGAPDLSGLGFAGCGVRPRRSRRRCPRLATGTRTSRSSPGRIVIWELGHRGTEVIGNPDSCSDFSCARAGQR